MEFEEFKSMIEELKITKQDWETNKFSNETLIKTNLMQIEMAKRIIELCDEKIKEFPSEPEQNNKD